MSDNYFDPEKHGFIKHIQDRLPTEKLINKNHESVVTMVNEDQVKNFIQTYSTLSERAKKYSEAVSIKLLKTFSEYATTENADGTYTVEELDESQVNDAVADVKDLVLSNYLGIDEGDFTAGSTEGKTAIAGALKRIANNLINFDALKKVLSNFNMESIGNYTKLVGKLFDAHANNSASYDALGENSDPEEFNNVFNDYMQSLNEQVPEEYSAAVEAVKSSKNLEDLVRGGVIQ